MIFEDLIREGLIEKIPANLKRADKSIERARKDLTTAKANLSIDEEWAYAIAYHGMLRAGRALMLAEGYRPKGKDRHKTVVSFCGRILGEEFKKLVNNFDWMRRKRHDFIYEPERPIAKQEAEQALSDAQTFIEKIISLVKTKNPQKDLPIL
ncbi:MAG: HEPN domain-containing protein [Candidatus Omnitrophica bacterium]|nr:HEPN domain-containing protein [Candidatus Omnitrophota bacterium]